MKKYVVVTVSESCPGGPNRAKRKMEDGTWQQEWCYTNGEPVLFDHRSEAFEYAWAFVVMPTNGIKNAFVRNVAGGGETESIVQRIRRAASKEELDQLVEEAAIICECELGAWQVYSYRAAVKFFESENLEMAEILRVAGKRWHELFLEV